ncbi:NAD(P)-dependent dehydrogenase (short-subunit alcohol dehydrogenase family) [Novosphingobium sp. PhB165]|uniref:SDR family NAD(P)-dependent oxidoreductase n=1 Tax=Novosphingobium sp. PhB165 TaxID=2485105 RepID=UPI00104CA899|nr:SDR family oxidoreductase [Novosphingobium sp. PhB165]TCM20712.1 NAD(P)-dependent dehydrogenase (short-subunit alcohol dehydrogenase family) [Novosphingobium sp. PhB165]
MTSGYPRLEGKVAIVSGGGQGIGAAIAVAYAREGARVLITGRTREKLASVAAEIENSGGTCAYEVAIAGEREQSAKVVERAMRDWARVDILVNNAHSFTDYLPLADPMMEEHCRIDFQSAFFGSLQFMQLCHPHMAARGGGSIINFGSSFGIRCEPGFLAYAASKEAIRTLTRTAAREWGTDGIRVNTILPSAMSPKALSYLEESRSYDAELAKVAVGRFGEPADIAPTAIFLASDESAYVTGQTIGVDGGSTML